MARGATQGWTFTRVFWALGLVVAASWVEMAHGNGDAELFDVRVQLKWHHQFQFAGYYAALAQGYYRDAGLNVSLEEPVAYHTPIDQLMMGRVQFAIADTGALIYRSTGVPLVALGAIFQSSPSVLITRNDGTIRSLEDLRGQRVMLGGGYMNAELIAMFRNRGIGIDELEVVPSEASLGPFIEGRTVAHNGYTTNEPFLLETLGIDIQLFYPGDYGVDFYGDILLTTEALIEAHPEVVSAFWEATRRGWAYATAYPEEIIDLILRDYNTQDKTRAHLEFEARELTGLIMPQVVPIGYMHHDRWVHIERVFREQGLLVGSVDLDRFIYTPTSEPELWAWVRDYRWPLIIAVLATVGILLLLHSLRLKAEVDTRTRELRQAKQFAEIEARTDYLTDLPNRRHFLEALTRCIAQAERYDLPLSLVTIDVDLFKQINDRFGHAAGDDALRQLSDVLKRFVRSGDIAARMGGEEFAIVCVNTDVNDATALAQRLCEAAAETSILHGEISFQVTLSVGVATRDPGEGMAELLKKSDAALYNAKAQGRNKVCQWC